MRTADGYIISKCLNGNPAAFGLLVDKYKASVYALAYSELRNFHDAEDATQEVFIKAYEKLRTLRRYDSFHAWLYSITFNMCKNLIRAQSRRPDHEFIEDQDPETLEESSVGRYREETIYESIHEALASLPRDYRQALTLYHLGGMNSREIAEFLGINPTAVRHRLSRARALLKEEMLDMMSETFKHQRLQATFTFRIVESVKRININPMPKIVGLPWGISLATGLLITILSLNPNLSLLDHIGISSGSSSPGETRVLSIGEFPVDVLNISEMVVISDQQESGNGGGNPGLPAPQRAPLMAANDGAEFVRSWPEEILGLRSPRGAAVDSSGIIYVADTYNHRIQKFDSNGNPLMKWGTYGSGNGRFYWPCGITTDSAGNIYVADFGNHRIQKFDSEGKFLMKWGTKGSGDGQFDLPGVVTVDGVGSVYVADIYNHRIQKFDSEGKFLMKWGDEGAADGQFQCPVGVAVDSSGDVYVAEEDGHRVQKFNSEGKFLKKWGSLGQGDGQFNLPRGIAIDGDENVYVADSGNSRIQKFDSNGKYLKKWGSRGSGDGKFAGIAGIAIDSDYNVYVADFNHRIQKFDSEGKFLKKWGSLGQGDGQFQYPWGIAVDSSGDVYVVDRNNHRIQKFDSEGKFLMKRGTQGSDDGQFNQPYGIAIDSDGKVYVADSGNHRIQKFDSDGRFLAKWGTPGSGDMEFNWPNGIAVSSSRDIYVADSKNNRIKVYRLIGGGAVEPGNKRLGKWGEVKRTELLQNFPNPFNPETWIPFSLSEPEHVTIRIYGSTGQLVRTLDLGRMLSGEYLSKEKAAYWDGRNEAGEMVASDVYFYVMEAGESVDSRKMVMVR